LNFINFFTAISGCYFFVFFWSRQVRHAECGLP